MKRLLCLIFVLTMSVSLFAGCGGGNNSKSDSASSAQKPSTDDVLFINADNESVYRIVRPENCNENITALATTVFKQMKNVLGVPVRQVADTEDGADTYEILIGDTNRSESASALEYLKEQKGGRYQDYIICTSGKKIVINAFTEETLTKAVNVFCETYIKKEGIKGGISHLVATEGSFTDITINGKSIKDFYIVRPHYNSSYLTQMQLEEMTTKVAEKTGYMLKIEEDAYKTEGAMEIIVGNTNRSGVEAIGNTDTYSIKVSGNKIYLNGGSPYATAMAVSEFSKMLLSGSVTDANSVEGSYETTAAGYDSASYYKPQWLDDFDYSEIGVNGVSSQKWWIISDDKEKFHAEGHNGKTSIRSVLPDVLRVEDGKLLMSAKYDDNYYYGAMLRSPYSLVYRYGYIEQSALLPNGGGLWSSLWTVSAGGDYCGQEIDINECFGNAKVVAANAHTWPGDDAIAAGWEHTALDGKYDNAKKYACPDGKTFGDDFHTFGYLWTDTELTFTCDGKVYFSYTINQDDQQEVAAFNTDQILILSLATGFASNGDLPEEGMSYWNESNTLKIDYVHLYQIKDGKQLWRDDVSSSNYR